LLVSSDEQATEMRAILDRLATLLAEVRSKLAMPQVDSNLLVLMGISSGTLSRLQIAARRSELERTASIL